VGGSKQNERIARVDFGRHALDDLLETSGGRAGIERLCDSDLGILPGACLPEGCSQGLRIAHGQAQRRKLQHIVGARRPPAFIDVSIDADCEHMQPRFHGI
jgi:hypothetical protein